MRTFTAIMLVCVIELTASIKVCNKNKLKGNTRLCIQNGNKLESSQTSVFDGTECFVVGESAIQYSTCMDGRWQTYSESLPIAVNEKRTKRGFWSSLGNALKCTFTLSILCDRPSHDQTPPTIKPGIIFVPAIAEPFQTYAKVTWEEPTAKDDKDGYVSVRRVGGRAPGRHFPEHDTTFSYIAKDNSGNTATCQVTIRVEVIRCSPPSILKNGYYICHPSTDFVKGGWCRFGCYDGFDLQGTDMITCQSNGIWSASQPTCKAWTCPEPRIINGADEPKCSLGNKYRSMCEYSCKTGFDMPPKVSKTIVCDINKQWRKQGSPRCIDVESPVFDVCPMSRVFGTDTGVDTATVYWKEPKVNDNSNETLKPSTNIQPGSILSTDIYEITYTAKDNQGNEARPCVFKAIVRDRRCPKLYPTPYVQISCPNGYRTGSSCSVDCDAGKTMNGSEFVQCKESSKGILGTWNWRAGHQTTCISTNKCNAISPPTNGAVVCDNWMGGQFCIIQCRNGTEMKGNWKKMFVCSKKGYWMPSVPVVHACKEPRHPRPIQYIYISYYFYGDCTDKETKEHIGQNLVNVIKSSFFSKEGCADPSHCHSENVQVSCGATIRNKRDANNITYDEEMLLSINLEIPVVTVDHNNGIDINETHMELVINVTRQLLENSTTIIFESTRVTLRDFKSLGIGVRCEDGYIKRKNSLSCVECPPGTFYSKSTRDCINCHKGKYQNKSGQFDCERCPIGKTTRTFGSTSQSDCEDACGPGTFSIDGILPCSPCEQGQYQPSYGQMKCNTCPGTRTTLSIGVADRSSCKEFDIEFPTDREKIVQLHLQSKKIFTDFTFNVWFKGSKNYINKNESIDIVFVDNNNTTFALWQMKYLQIDKSVQVLYDIDINDDHWHSLKIEVQECSIVAYLNGIMLLNILKKDCSPTSITSVRIIAGDGFNGSISQLNIWKGTNVNISPFRCFSRGQRAGLSWQEFADAELIEAFINVPSACDDFDSCKSSPCLHGKCTDLLHGFRCVCNPGYTGKQCDHNIDDCVANMCMNNAACIDGVGNYSCLCSKAYSGKLCEIRMVDGKWSEWSNWTECTTTCGPGEQFRKRLCNNPTPDNGGDSCSGDATETVDCQNMQCQVCPMIEAPDNGSISCSNVSGSIKCTIACDEGFDFDIAPLDLYICGPETAFEWNFENENNPLRSMPKCTEIVLPEKITGHFSVHYKDLMCSTGEKRNTTMDAISTTVKQIVNNLPCIMKKTCVVETLHVTNCKRSKRQVRNVATAGISLDIATTDNDNTTFTIMDLEDSFKNLHYSASNGNFTVAVFDERFELDYGSSEISGTVSCKPGMTRVRFYCVPCGHGSYAFESYCRPCEKGTYQEKQGQLSCLPCPSGTTTLGIGSTKTEDCIVSIDKLIEGIEVTSIAVGCSCAVVVVVIAVVVYRRYRYYQKKKAITPTDLNKPDIHATSDYQMSTLGPAKPAFSFSR